MTRKRKYRKNYLNSLKGIVDKITSAHENYAQTIARMKQLKAIQLKEKKELKNIDVELENWKSLKVNSEKMINDLQEKKKKLIMK